MPPRACTPKTSSESSALSIFFRPDTPQRQTTPAMRPMAKAPGMPTLPAAGVIATRPATAPEAAPSIEGLPLNIHSKNVQESTAQAVARNVFMNASTAKLLASSALPALKPNQPNHSSDGADHGHGQVVRRHLLLAEADALAHQVGAHQARDAGVDVHHRAAREVERAPLPDHAGLGVELVDDLGVRVRVRAHPEPHHVRDRRVGEREPQHHEDQHRGELHALGEGAQDQRAGDRRERGLEGDEEQLRDRRGLGERRRHRELALRSRRTCPSGTAGRSRRRTRCPR